METPLKITKTERVDDVPLLLAQMDKMNIAMLLNKHFPMHGNWQGLSFGETVVTWLAYPERRRSSLELSTKLGGRNPDDTKHLSESRRLARTGF
jgi:hypothetical protein